VGGVLVVVAVVAVVVFALHGSSAGKASAHGTVTAEAKTPGHHTKKHAKTSAPAFSAAETDVVVLNGTEVYDLAHRVSAELRQDGYTRAAPLDGRPPGANQVSVVQYATGHQAEAQAVARKLGVSLAQPIEATVASLAGSATVVVIVGLDKAATSP
jgi:hypothetical protein